MIQRAIVLPILFSVISLVAVLPNPAEAVQVRVDFTSTVDYVQDAPVLSLSPNLGDLATGFFIYDTDTADENPVPNQGLFHGGSMSVTIDGTTFTNEISPEYLVTNLGPTGGAVMSVSTTYHLDRQDVLVNGVPQSGGQIAFNFFEVTGGLPNDSLPYPFPPGFMLQQFNLTQTDGNGVITYDSLQSLHVTYLPEPTTLALASLGCLGLVTMMRRRNRAAGH